MSVAEQLHQAREAKRLTVEQVAEITKIRSDHIRALEEGDFNVFSAPVYIRGFVRTYSTLLKLDVPQVMATLDQELGQTRKFAEPPPLSNEPRGILDIIMLQLSKIDWKRGVVILVAAVVILGTLGTLIVLKRQRTADPLRGVKPAAYQSAPHSSGDTLSLPAPKR
ncbi:MAG TPA: helix-turn-helix transcriptional regulator [Clostridia bacterium]|nr:helix-turn-helix transcriptional regulator [Clostridia bacterium]